MRKPVVQMIEEIVAQMVEASRIQDGETVYENRFGQVIDPDASQVGPTVLAVVDTNAGDFDIWFVLDRLSELIPDEFSLKRLSECQIGVIRAA